jgi:hypothetical protein
LSFLPQNALTGPEIAEVDVDAQAHQWQLRSPDASAEQARFSNSASTAKSHRSHKSQQHGQSGSELDTSLEPDGGPLAVTHSHPEHFIPESLPDPTALPTESMQSYGLFSTENPKGTSPGAYLGFELSPGMLTDDGIFLPGSTYQELHTTLRHHVFETAMSQEPSRQTSLSPSQTDGENTLEPLQQESSDRSTIVTGPNQTEPVDHQVELDEHLEYLLWKNWLTEIADWLDKFDRDCHFRRTLPVLAKSSRHLFYAMLALSARQLERKDGSIPTSLTLSLYQAAVHLLVPELHRKDISVIASCVVICVLEMMSCSPKAWRRHLDGCACLIRSMGIRGDSPGVEGALFWCFARMDVCGGLISKERTLIPIDEWSFTANFSDTVAMFTSTSDGDWSARFASYLNACTTDLLFSSSTPRNPQSPVSLQKDDPATYPRRWQELFEIIENWYESRPAEMLPIVQQQASSDSNSPFPTLLFGSGAAISGNQLHHTSALLMLQNIPHNIKRRSTRSILWHARRICAISICNDHHGCWTNAIQPLWLAGQVMSHPTEHRAIEAVYKRIEAETGWGATWRADDLKQFWGEIE